MRNIILLFFVLCISLVTSAQQHPGRLLSELITMVDKHHYQPRKIDSELSKDFYNAFIKLSDPGNDYFTEADLVALEQYRNRLHERILKQDTAFYHDVQNLLFAKAKTVRSYIAKISAIPFDFTATDYYDAGVFKNRAKDEKELYQRWYIKIKTGVMRSLMDKAASQYLLKSFISKSDIFSKESQARELVKNRQLKKMEVFANAGALKEFLTSIYLNAYLHTLDPHTAYMNLEESETFKSSLNTETDSFGFTIAENEFNEVIIDEIIPGGPAWMSGEIHSDDVLLSIRTGNNERAELAGLDIDEVSTHINGINNEKVELTLRKANGKEQTVVLQKQKLENDENIVKSFIISYDKHKMGYVSLPAFYTQWEDETGSSCAQDVAKEVIKLKKDNISGIILDLRFNGGGSLTEALEMAGIFIDEGALCMIKSKDGKLTTLKDLNRGVIWNGPLLVLVNGYSASASELIAATLQDYNRAIIAGTPTHGKASSQVILPFLNEMNTVRSSDESAVLKITTGKIYRTTGKTAQKHGVVPDILLPDIYETFTEREISMPFALSGDTVSSYKYFKPLSPLNLSMIKQLSTDRVAKNKRFSEMKIIGPQLNQYYKPGKLSLQWSEAEKRLKNNIDLNNRLDSILYKNSELYTVDNNSSDKKYLANSITHEINKRWIERLRKDVYLEESILILSDFINPK